VDGYWGLIPDDEEEEEEGLSITRNANPVDTDDDFDV